MTRLRDRLASAGCAGHSRLLATAGLVALYGAAAVLLLWASGGPTPVARAQGGGTITGIPYGLSLPINCLPNAPGQQNPLFYLTAQQSTFAPGLYTCTGFATWVPAGLLAPPAAYNATTGVLTLGTGNGYSGVLNFVGSGANTVGIGVTTGGAGGYTIRLPAANSTANGQVLSHFGGLGASDPVLVWSDQAQVAVVAVAGLPACNNATEGMERGVTDSNTATWGATVAAGGANHVLAYCDGTLWTVAGK